MSKYDQYVRSRADAPEWVAPLAGMTLIVEDGPLGDHAEVLADFIEELASYAREKREDNIGNS